MTGTARAARFAAAYALLRASATIADHWLQTTHQAACKGWHDGDVDATGAARTSAEGRRACAAHVATYTAAQGAALLLGSRVLGLRLRPQAVVCALALSGATHYVADRRRPLKKLADRVGKAPFYSLTSNGMNGAYQLDQAFHHAMETAAAVIAAR
ncbi:hypothetical protein [Streptomyces sp. NRRL B-24484]|uniref:hypothetical protein n=1 Tax=Streptomyces sp. NRRL B-24484 TaxID=1463833 RepID=UPI0005B9CB31|nr:hypothetical protein [Streptomyces sp. NRRL B-24484]